MTNDPDLADDPAAAFEAYLSDYNRGTELADTWIAHFETFVRDHVEPEILRRASRGADPWPLLNAVAKMVHATANGIQNATSTNSQAEHYLDADATGQELADLVTSHFRRTARHAALHAANAGADPTPIVHAYATKLRQLAESLDGDEGDTPMDQLVR